MNIALLTILLSVFSFTTLSAQDAPSTLGVAKTRLKASMKEVKDPQLQKLGQDALKKIDRAHKDPKKADAALHAVNKVLAVIKQKHIHTVSTSSSGKSCDVRDEISELDSQVKACCTDIKRLLTELLNFVHTAYPCDPIIPIDTVPVLLAESGKYCVTTDLTYTGPGAAIQVSASNVHINFHNHDLTLTDPAAIGILVENASEFVLENDSIQGTSIFKTSTSAAVSLLGVNKATLRNVFTKNTTKGLFLVDCTDVLVEFCHFDSHEGTITPIFPSPATLVGTGDGAGVFVSGSNGVTVDTCTFVGANLGSDPTRTGFGVHIEENAKNFTLKDSAFSNLLGSIHAVSVDGVLVENCTFNASTVSNFNIAQFGSCELGTVADNVIIRNATFTQSQVVQGFDGLLFVAGSGCLLEDIVVNSSSQDIQTYSPAAIHIGNQSCGNYSNLVGRNCIVTGTNGRSLYIDNGSNIVFEDSQFSGASVANVYMNAATSSSIRNSTIFNGSSGVIISNPTSSGAQGNAIENCLVYNNTNYGIEVLDQNKHHLSGNHAWSNATGIYLLYAGFTETYNNTSCKNTTQSCNNVTPSQLPGASPILAGSNVCCTP